MYTVENMFTNEIIAIFSQEEEAMEFTKNVNFPAFVTYTIL